MSGLEVLVSVDGCDFPCNGNGGGYDLCTEYNFG